jgi:thiol-disulfide isomerase/thioredoxin
MNISKFIIYIIIIIIILSLLVSSGIYIDKHAQRDNLTFATSAGTVKLPDYGSAPEFKGITNWLNSGPLTIAGLKGKVVLIDFWTYSCINCIRTMPYVTKWYDTYKDQGLVIIGVHTPEFAFEKDASNVADAIKRFNIHYPVAQDNDYGTWNAYGNQYWPAEYLIDKTGHIVYTHFGEGEYDQTENAIRELLGLNSTAKPDNGQDLSQVASPEMYFGTDREHNLTGQQSPSSVPQNYTSPSQLNLNEFSLDGNWQFAADKATLVKGSGKIKLHFSSGRVYFVAESIGQPTTLHITVDGQIQPDVTVGASELYTLFNSNNYKDHQLEIDIPTGGLDAFTFTFG